MLFSHVLTAIALFAVGGAQAQAPAGDRLDAVCSANKEQQAKLQETYPKVQECLAKVEPVSFQAFQVSRSPAAHEGDLGPILQDRENTQTKLIVL